MTVVHEIVDAIEKQARTQYQEEVPTKLIGEMIMKQLHDVDKVAYVRFASVYRQFEDVSEFVDEVRSMPKFVTLKKGE